MIACQQQEETVGPECCGEKQNRNMVQTFQREDMKKRCGWSAEVENQTAQCRLSERGREGCMVEELLGVSDLTCAVRGRQQREQ